MIEREELKRLLKGHLSLDVNMDPWSNVLVIKVLWLEWDQGSNEASKTELCSEHVSLERF